MEGLISTAIGLNHGDASEHADVECSELLEDAFRHIYVRVAAACAPVADGDRDAVAVVHELNLVAAATERGCLGDGAH